MNTFSSLTEAFQAYPTCIGIDFTEFSTWFKFELLLPSGDSYTEQGIKISDPQPESIIQEILSQTHWQIVEIGAFENKGVWMQKIVNQLHKFTQLRKLWIRYGYTNFHPDVTLSVSLNGLPHLTEIHLQGCTISLSEPLSQATALHLESTSLEEIQDALACLNPQKITQLSFSKADLTNLPEQLKSFTHLKVIDLAYNGFETIPVWITSLKELTNISLYANPILKKTELKESMITKLITQSNKQNTSTPLRELYLNLLQNQPNESTTPKELLPALSMDIELLNRKAMQELLKKVTNPLKETGTSSQHIALIGKFKGISVPETIEQLKQHGIEASEKLTPTTTLLCIGESLTAKQVTEVLKYQLPLALPQHLRDFLQQLDRPYLKESDTETQENLFRLLRSQEESNVKLAAEIMLSGGVPDDLFYMILLLSFLKAGGYRAGFKKVLEKYTTPEQYDFIVKQQKAGFYKTIDLLFDKPSELFDLNKLVATGLRIFAIENSQRMKSYNDEGFLRPFHYLVKRCFVAGGEPARLAIKAQLEEKTLNVLFTDDSYFGKFKLPTELLEFTDVERIICSQNVMTEVATNRKTIQKMSSLKELVLYHYSVDITTSYGKEYYDGWQKGVAKLKDTLPHLQITVQTY
ncbi:leucine-rich repeat domain-containing protein [Xanthocytophaga flava]|uniref:leucine-rich repeat domain-containing protein n=1 Tax=Xanthocytophaga flava TaxID=3048013 RepID=UPI0028D39E0E|nr:hypothetical protein [Xanthocytophaga flavus]MDJ1471835.1 hypothetical protein [Xanthocytophaga flavus]